MTEKTEKKTEHDALEIRCLPEGGYVVATRGAYRGNFDDYNGILPLAAFENLSDALSWVNCRMVVRRPFEAFKKAD